MDFVLVLAFKFGYGLAVLSIDTHYPSMETCSKAGEVAAKLQPEMIKGYLCVPATEKAK